MVFLYFAIPILVLTIALYMYFFLKRACIAFGANLGRKWARALIGIAAVAIAAFSLDIRGFGTVIVMHFLMFSCLLDLIVRIVRLIFRQKYENGFQVWKKIYGCGVVPLILTMALLAFGWVNMYAVTETDYTLYTDKAIRAEGYRVALIADVHYGVSLNEGELQAVCDEIEAQHPDLVILCGDIVDDGTSEVQVQEVFRTLASIETPYGVYYVYGNHDRPFRGIESDYTEEMLMRTIQQNGITVLRDTVQSVTEDLVLIGREDRSSERLGSERRSIDSLVSEADPNAFILTLDHQPNDYAANGAAGTDLVLSGHTHGGQFWPLDILQSVIPFNDAVYGQVQIDEDTQAIVTSGLAGWNYPIKTAAPAEYVMIDIQANNP